MVRTAVLNSRIAGFVHDLAAAGYGPTRIILFGSYAKGTPHEWSDIDLAVWAKGFDGARVIDVPRVAPLLRPYPDIQLHPFAAGETKAENPFIEEIERTGKDYSHLLTGLAESGA